MEWESSTSSTYGANLLSSNPNVGNNYRPYLEIVSQPQGKFRFRYKSEMTGKHGSLLGVTASISGITAPVNLTTGSGACGSGQRPNVSSGPGLASGGQLLSVLEGQLGQGSFSTTMGGGGNVNINTASQSPSTSAYGITSTSSTGKVFPSVKLQNFPTNAIIRCSLVCENSPYYPHPHLLEMGQSAVGTGSPESETFSPENCYIEIPISNLNDHTATFPGLNIIYVSKKDTRKQLLYKISQLEDNDTRKVSTDRIDDLSLNINLNVVALYFEAFVRTPDNRIQLLCNPVVTAPIQHNKSTQTGDLRIVRIDKCSSFCTGNEEVFILVEKVDKHNIQVKFFQESDKGVEIWKSYGKFSKLDVHHQFAIVFKTPPYRSCDIDTEIDVWIQLERPSDGATSQPIRFKYKPIERIRKMPKRQRSRGGGSDNPDPDARSSRPFEPPRAGPDSPGGNSDNSNNNPSGNEDSDQDNGNNQLSGSSNIRQGSDNVKFPCDTPKMATEESCQSKTLAMSVALSICQGLHSWAETSDFSLVLQKLRHLLCLVNENGDNSLHSAIIHQQKEPFTQILETLTSCPDTCQVINEPNLHGLTPISLAVLTNRLDFVQELLRHNVDLSIANKEGDGPLHIAVKTNNVLCVKYLLQAPSASAAINKLNYSSLSPLHIAVSNGFTELVDILCINKANLTCQEGTLGSTALHLAVQKETKESIICTMIILKNRGDADLANIQNYRGDTPLHIAANCGSTTLCSLLLYNGADPMIENHVRKETEDDEEEETDERLCGQTAFDVAASEQVLRVLKSTMDGWEIVLKACSPLLSPPSITQVPELRHLSGSGDKDMESKNLDSGIDINNFNSSQFLNSSCSNQLSDT